MGLYELVISFLEVVLQEQFGFQFNNLYPILLGVYSI